MRKKEAVASSYPTNSFSGVDGRAGGSVHVFTQYFVPSTGTVSTRKYKLVAVPFFLCQLAVLSPGFLISAVDVVRDCELTPVKCLDWFEKILVAPSNKRTGRFRKNTWR